MKEKIWSLKCWITSTISWHTPFNFHLSPLGTYNAVHSVHGTAGNGREKLFLYCSRWDQTRRFIVYECTEPGRLLLSGGGAWTKALRRLLCQQRQRRYIGNLQRCQAALLTTFRYGGGGGGGQNQPTPNAGNIFRANRNSPEPCSIVSLLIYCTQVFCIFETGLILKMIFRTVANTNFQFVILNNNKDFNVFWKCREWRMWWDMCIVQHAFILKCKYNKSMHHCIYMYIYLCIIAYKPMLSLGKALWAC